MRIKNISNYKYSSIWMETVPWRTIVKRMFWGKMPWLGDYHIWNEFTSQRVPYTSQCPENMDPWFLISILKLKRDSFQVFIVFLWKI